MKKSIGKSKSTIAAAFRKLVATVIVAASLAFLVGILKTDAATCSQTITSYASIPSVAQNVTVDYTLIGASGDGGWCDATPGENGAPITGNTTVSLYDVGAIGIFHHRFTKIAIMEILYAISYV